MDKATIIETFETFIDDTLDSAIEESLAEQARLELEVELRLQCSKKLDTSKTTSAGATYLTPYAMQADVLIPSGSRIYVGTEPVTGIPFEDRMAYKDQGSFYYVDLFSGNFYLTGTQTGGQQITFPYITKGTTFQDAEDDDTILKWPEGLHILIPMKMAQIWFPVDQGDKSRNWTPEWLAFYNKTKNSLIDWDAAWKNAAIGGATPYGSSQGSNPDRINDLP